MRYIALLVLLTGCQMTTPDKTQVVTSTTVCIFAMCESQDQTDRIGDPSSGGDVNEVVDETNTNSQSESADLSVPAEAL